MNQNNIKKELEKLRNMSQFLNESLNTLLEELEKEVPNNPRKRKRLKSERITKWDNYLITGKIPKKK